MDQNNGTVAAQPGAQSAPAAQPTQQTFQPPQGYRVISDDDHSRLTRAEQQARGFQPLYDRISKAGIKSIDDWAKYEPDFQTLAKKGGPGWLSKAFGPDADKDLSAGEPKGPAFDPEKFKADILTESERKSFEREYEAKFKDESKYVESLVAKFRGEEEWDPYETERNRRALNDYLYEVRGTYGDDNPHLKGRPTLLNDSIGEKALKYFGDLKNQAKAKSTAERAKDAASGQFKSTAAGGGSSSSGKPTTEPKGRVSNKPSDDEFDRAISHVQARRTTR